MPILTHPHVFLLHSVRKNNPPRSFYGMLWRVFVIIEWALPIYFHCEITQKMWVSQMLFSISFQKNFFQLILLFFLVGFISKCYIMCTRNTSDIRHQPSAFVHQPSAYLCIAVRKYSCRVDEIIALYRMGLLRIQMWKSSYMEAAASQGANCDWCRLSAKECFAVLYSVWVQC